MANPIPVLMRPLAELEKSIDAGDVPGCLRSAGRLVELSAGLWTHKPAVDKAGVVMPEGGRGDRAYDCERLVAKLQHVIAAPSASGLPWDGSLLRVILEFLMALLKPVVTPPS